MHCLQWYYCLIHFTVIVVYLLLFIVIVVYFIGVHWYCCSFLLSFIFIVVYFNNFIVVHFYCFYFIVVLLLLLLLTYKIVVYCYNIVSCKVLRCVGGGGGGGGGRQANWSISHACRVVAYCQCRWRWWRWRRQSSGGVHARARMGRARAWCGMESAKANWSVNNFSLRIGPERWRAKLKTCKSSLPTSHPLFHSHDQAWPVDDGPVEVSNNGLRLRTCSTDI